MTANVTEATRARRSALWRLLKRSRPRFWLYLAGPALVGLAYGAESVAELFSPIAVVLVAFFLLPANVYLYGVNDVFDADVDRENPKKEDKEIPYGGDALTLVAVAVTGVLGVLLIAVAPPAARGWLVGFLALSTAYSAPPLRLKVRPPLDSLSNGLYVLPGGAAYAAVTGSAPPLGILASAWLWTMAMHTFSAVPDIDPDRSAGIRTTATALGRAGALGYCFACWAAAAAVVTTVDPRGGALFAVYPVFLLGIAASDVSIDRAYWWFPFLNAAVGMVLTLAGLWGITHG